MNARAQVVLAGSALLAVLAMALVRAWLCDDIFITFRAVEQMGLGNGPVYNIGERVQVFTHPLWFGVLAAWSALGGSLYPGTIALSLLVFAGGMLALCAAFRDRPAALAAVLLALFFARTAMDYATSGLETPLSFALGMIAVYGLRSGRRSLAVIALALMPLNRLDLMAWALPFAMIVPVASWRGRIGVLAALGAPAAAWALFSTFYYGSPVPNTALAKLSDSMLARMDQGLSYVTASMLTDPGMLALLVIAVGVGIARWRSAPLVRAGLASLALSLAYVLWAGGDFMLGRFLLPATWAAIVVLLAALPGAWQEAGDRRWFGGLFALLSLSSAISGHSTLGNFGIADAPGKSWGLYYNGALDERRFYLPWLGIFAVTPVQSMKSVTVTPAQTEPEVTLTIGARGYFAKRDHAVVDIWALADPLLARIRPMTGGRPGHAFRPMPPEWWRWREPAQSLGEERLDALARDLRIVHRSPDLVSPERFAAIVRLLWERSIPYEVIDTQLAGEWIDIAVHARRIDRRIAPEGLPVIWIDRDCVPDAPRLGPGWLIPAGLDGISHVRCPAKDFTRIPFKIRGGSLEPVSRRADYLDEPVRLVNPPGRWLPDVPAWSVSGWLENPTPALVVSLLLAALSALLFMGKRK